MEWSTAAVAPHILLIGECGLDRVCDAPYSMQLQALERHIQLSEETSRPLLLHCVRAIDDVLALRRQMHASQPWIWHGYRGGAQQLRSLIPHGFYFSFGFRYRAEALRACPRELLLLETDDDSRPVSALYEQVAIQLGTNLTALQQQMRINYEVLFAHSLPC